MLRAIFLLTVFSPSFDFTETLFLNLFNKIASFTFGYQPVPNLEPLSKITSEKYDFIIVGGGSSGAVLANRLSENQAWKILLLEAGTHANEFTKVPILAPIFQLTPYNWNHMMEPEPTSCLGMIDQVCAWPRGKGLGGTSLINYMIYTRGNRYDFDKWSEISPLWSWNQVEPYYKKSENCQLSTDECQNSHHSIGGYLTIEYPFKSTLTDSFIEAGLELGAKKVEYHSEPLGFGRIQATQNRGRRASTSQAFLNKQVLKQRPNLTILTNAYVTKILIELNQANGVEFYHNRKMNTVTASKEVILSAGSFNSPQLLLLAGIGPKNDLKALKIQSVVDLPVGMELYDHLAYLGLSFRINQTMLPRSMLLEPKEWYNWQFNGKGVFTSLAGNEGLAYIKINNATNQPDLELIFSAGGSIEADYGLVVANSIRMNRTIYGTVFKPQEQYATWTILPVLLHPKSKGFLKLRSKNPFEKVVLHGNYFTDEKNEDLSTLLAGIRYVQKLAKSLAFQKYNSTINRIKIPGCDVFEYDTDEYWYCAIKHLASTVHHQIGTCKMGQDGVVNERLQVYGVKKLRVIDASIIPVTLSAHTNAPAIMIAEKGADLIKEDWKS